MALLLLASLCSVAAASRAGAEEFRFRGHFVETYLADAGFLDRLPRGTRLNCENGLCSSTKAVRIYVFRNGETIKRFWSTDYCDVMFDEPEAIRRCGDADHVALYDQSDQLLYRDQPCRTLKAGLIR